MAGKNDPRDGRPSSVEEVLTDPSSPSPFGPVLGRPRDDAGGLERPEASPEDTIETPGSSEPTLAGTSPFHGALEEVSLPTQVMEEGHTQPLAVAPLTSDPTAPAPEIIEAHTVVHAAIPTLANGPIPVRVPSRTSEPQIVATQVLRRELPEAPPPSSGDALPQHAELLARRKRIIAGEEPFGPYMLFGTLGSGGMAEVRLALDSSASGAARVVALKRLLPASRHDSEAVAMFHEEIRISERLAHPNVIRAFSSGVIDGVDFLALEMVDGVSLDELRDASPAPLPLGVVVEVGIQVAAALGYIHDLADAEGRPLGLVHRDVTPENVLIDRAGLVKLVDFGIAHFAGRQHETQVGFVKGKIRYMAPEQLEGHPLDRRTDLYALGLVLAEMLGDPSRLAPAFSNQRSAEFSVAEACRAVGAPESLAQLLGRMVAYKPERRPGSAREVAAALSAAHGDGARHLAAHVTTRFFQHVPPLEQLLDPGSETEDLVPTRAAPHASGSRVSLLSEPSRDARDSPLPAPTPTPTPSFGRTLAHSDPPAAYWLAMAIGFALALAAVTLGVAWLFLRT